MQRVILLCLLMSLLKNSVAQTEAIKPLQKGDMISAIRFQKFLEPSTSVQLSSLKGKVIILDFWNIGCLACLKSMPKMDSLQKQFGSDIQVVLITNNSTDEVNNLFNRIKIKKPDLPIVVEDTIYYKKLFPHVGDPLHVWINRSGVITAITDGHNATVSNIQSLFNGQNVTLYTRPSTDDPKLDSCLLNASSSSLKKFVNFYSIYLNNLNEETTINRLTLIKDSQNKKIVKVSALNIPLLTLYSFAYSRDLFGFDVNIKNLRYNNRIEIQTKNPLDIRYAYSDSLLDEWNNRNLISYETEIPSAYGLSIFSIIQSDLDRYTPFEAQIETRKMTCLVLKRTSKKDKMKTRNRKEDAVNFYKGNYYSIINQQLSASLLPHLVIANQALAYPIVDETNYEGPVDMILNTKLNDLKGLRKELNKYDLDIVLTERAIKVLVIRDKKHEAVSN